MKKPQTFVLPALIVFLEMITYLATDMYLPALPAMSGDLKIPLSLVQMTLTMWFLGSGSIQLLVGPLSDRYGRKPVLLLGGVVFLISTVICATTLDIHTLLIARFIQGTSVCTTIVAGYSSIHELFEQKTAIKILSWMSSITVLAPAVGPILGAILLQWGTWRLIFWVLAISSVIALVLLVKFMPESNPNGKQQHPIHLKKIMKNYGTILSNKSFVAHTLCFLVLFSSLIAWLTAGTFLVVDSFHYSVKIFTLFQSLIFGAFITGTFLIRAIIKRYDVKHLINVGLTLVLTGGISGAIFTTISPDCIWSLIIPMTIFGAGAGLTFSPLSRIAMESSDQAMGAKMALYSGSISIGGTLGSGLISKIYNGELSCLAYVVCIAAIIACCCEWLIPHPKSHKE